MKISHLMEKETLIRLNQDGDIIGTVDKRIAHKEGIPHIAVHVWAVDAEEFLIGKSDDVYLHVAKRSLSRSENGREYYLRTAGGHARIKDSGSKDMMRLKECQYVLKNLKREVAEEVCLVLGDDGFVFDTETGEKLFENHNLKYLGKRNFNITIKKNIDGKIKKLVDNNEIIYLFVCELNGEINKYDKEEISAIEKIKSKEFLKIIEENPEKFGVLDPKDWKGSQMYNIMKDVIYQVQQIYNIK